MKKKIIFIVIIMCVAASVAVLFSGCLGIYNTWFSVEYDVEEILTEYYSLDAEIQTYVAFDSLHNEFNDYGEDAFFEYVQAMPEYDKAIDKISKFEANHERYSLVFCKVKDTEELLTVFACDWLVLKSRENPDWGKRIQAVKSDYIYVLGYEDGSNPEYKNSKNLYDDLFNYMFKVNLNHYYGLETESIEFECSVELSSRYGKILEIKGETELSVSDIEKLPEYAVANQKFSDTHLEKMMFIFFAKVAEEEEPICIFASQMIPLRKGSFYVAGYEGGKQEVDL